MTRYFTSWLTEQVKLPQSTADNLFAVVIIGLVLGSLVGGIASDWAERRFSSKGRILASQFSLLALVPAMLGFVFLARNAVEVVGCAFVIAFFVDWTRQSCLQPMIQNIMPPELRGTALALAEFIMGAGSQLLVMGYGRFADRHGLPDTFLYFGCGSWLAAFLIDFLLYLTYPKEYHRLRQQMVQRRDLLANTETDGPGPVL